MADTSEIYIKLIQVILDIEKIDSHLKLTAPGFMDLYVDVLSKDGPLMRIAMAHNYKSGGDIIPDPDMEITIDFEREEAWAETYQDAYRFRIAFNDAAKKEMNEFLLMWLGNMIEQGHKMPDAVGAD